MAWIQKDSYGKYWYKSVKGKHQYVGKATNLEYILHKLFGYKPRGKENVE